MVVRTEGRKITDIKKIVNKLESANIALVPNIELEEILNDNNERIFLNRLIAMATDISERKRSRYCIVLEYGNGKLTRTKEKKIEVVLEQMLHQMEYTNVCMLINISPVKGQNLRDNISSKHLTIKELKVQ